MSKNLHRNSRKQRIDRSGSPISVVRVNTDESYSDIYLLLQSYINESDLSAWEKLKYKIDYLYFNMIILLDNLDKETNFKNQVLSETSKGKKLLFKPNCVSVDVIDELNHGAGPGAPICTQWLFVAALMRYFHDSLNISYYQMTFGEASTTDDMLAGKYSSSAKRPISNESALEGKNGDFYGGWGFYFVRKYLYETHPKDHTDNPMNGYENSVNSDYIPPGKADDRLMLYDLNNIYHPDRGRTVKVPNGGNFDEITIHKVIIGGDEYEKDDYPGCILINIPILKMHAQDLLTNAIKNLGIGLYPSYCVDEASSKFKYSHYSNFKSKIPHSPWVMELDEDTLLPVTDKNGNYIREKTLGFCGTQCDIVKSVQDQGILIINICDAINILNISHNPDGDAIPIPEGFMISSLDPLALDFFCARYCFNNLNLATGKALMIENNWPTEFAQLVPLPYIQNNNILTTTAYDSPLFRYSLYDYAQSRDIGQKDYYITGYDTLTDTPLTSVDGHIGRVENKNFIELITDTMYYNPSTFLHHLQLTVLSYAKCCDKLTETNLYNEFMTLYDENNDGVIDYDEKGRGYDNAQLAFLSKLWDMGYSKVTDLKRNALMIRYYLKYTNTNWNSENIDFVRDRLIVSIANQAYELSKLETLNDDFFITGMSFGRGQWPSWQTAEYLYMTGALYGGFTLDKISLDSVYGCAFQFADITSYDNYYTRNLGKNRSNPDAIKNYFKDIDANNNLLPFTLYVPKNLATLEDLPIPNVVGTDDKSKLFTVSFEEVW